MAALVISYARADQPLVRSLASLLRAALRDVGIDRAVFWDEDFAPGEPWFEQFCSEVDQSGQLFVFWCGHSSDSLQVQREYQYALKARKRVVPVLLDDTPLPKDLERIHGIDLRPIGGHGTPLVPNLGAKEVHFIEQEFRQAVRRSRHRWLKYLKVAVGILALVAVLYNRPLRRLVWPYSNVTTVDNIQERVERWNGDQGFSSIVSGRGTDPDIYFTIELFPSITSPSTLSVLHMRYRRGTGVGTRLVFISWLRPTSQQIEALKALPEAQMKTLAIEVETAIAKVGVEHQGVRPYFEDYAVRTELPVAQDLDEEKYLNAFSKIERARERMDEVLRKWIPGSSRPSQ